MNSLSPSASRRAAAPQSAITHPPSVLDRFAAFTLVELLVVISIIAILAALAFPAVNGAINSARKAQARNDVQQIATAVKAFKAEYGRLPNGATEQDSVISDISDNAALMAILTGDPNDTSGLNPKRIVFLEPKAAGVPKGGFFEGTFYDPWGSPYIVILDTDYNNRIEPDAPPGAPDAISVVAVFSNGPDAEPGPKHTDDIANYY